MLAFWFRRRGIRPFLGGRVIEAIVRVHLFRSSRNARVARRRATRRKVLRKTFHYTPGRGIDTDVCGALPGAIVMSSLRDLEAAERRVSEWCKKLCKYCLTMSEKVRGWRGAIRRRQKHYGGQGREKNAALCRVAATFFDNLMFVDRGSGAMRTSRPSRFPSLGTACSRLAGGARSRGLQGCRRLLPAYTAFYRLSGKAAPCRRPTLREGHSP